MDGYRLVTDVPMRLSDTDALGHINNAHYLSFLECARIDYMQKVLGRRDVEDFGVIIARVEIDYKSPAYHHETLRVGCRVEKLGGSSIYMDYRIEGKENGRLVARAKSVMVSFDYGLGKPVRIPEVLRTKMEDFDALS